MAFIQEALAGLPTRPVLYLSVTVLVLGFGYHYYTTWESCTGQAAFRERLATAVAAADGPVEFAPLTDFPWDRADILVNYKPEGATTDCPFGWGWSRGHRERLIAGDNLNVIVFLEGGRLVNFLEISRERADFADVANPYTPETAVFTVSGGNVLTPVP